MMNSYKIYRIFLKPENDRVVYVGMTSTHPEVRLYDLCGCNPAFKDALSQYGEGCFGCDIIEVVKTKEEAFEREAYWTMYYSSISPLFNIGIGKHCNAQKEKEEMREFYNRTLKPWIEEHGGANKGRKMPEEERKKHISNKRSKPVECVETGAKYPSINNAHQLTGIPYIHIDLACKFKTLAGGYHWNFIEGDA